MNKTPLILVFLLLAAGVGAFLIFGGGDPVLRPVGHDEPVRVTAVPDSDSGDDAVAAAPPAEDATFPEDSLRAAVEGDDAPSGTPLVVQVWQRTPGVPAAAAEVFMLEGSDEARALSAEPFAPHISTLAETKGRRFEADAAGRVVLPPVLQWAILTARLPGAYGAHIVGRDHAEVETITLQRDETVTIRVVDAAGKTVAGVPVGVVQRLPMQMGRDEMMAQLQKLEAGMNEVRQWMEQNPGERGLAAAKLQDMRAEFGRVRGEIARTDAGGQDGGARRGGDGAIRGVVTAKPSVLTRQPAANGKVAKADLAPRQYDTRVEVRARRRTDENGLAVFGHFQLARHYGDKWWPPEHHDQFEAVLLMPLQRPESRAFAGRPVPEDVIELRLPDTGSIALRTVDRDGRPFTHPVHAELRLAAEGSAPWSRLQARKEQNAVGIEFPFVGLGLQFGANCRLDDADFRWQMPAFAGPQRPGERVVVDLVVAPDEGMLFGRLLDTGGSPLRGAAVTFLINGLAGRLEGEEVRLDDNGRFHLPYQMRPQHEPPFRLQIRRPGAMPVAGLSLPLAALPLAHVTDIGELRLDGLGVVAHGVVQNDVGEPIPLAYVQLQRERNVGGQPARMEFREEAFATAHTDADGRYALFGELENARYRLRVDRKDHFQVDTPDLRRTGAATDIEMQRKSRLLGTVLAPDWMRRGQQLRVELVAVHVPGVAVGEVAPRDDQLHDHKGKTYVHFDGVRAGTYDLAFRLQGQPEPFLRVDGLVVTPGQQDVHPRLRDLDLGAYLFRFEIHPVDQNGQPVEVDRPQLTKVTRRGGATQFVGLVMKGSFGEVFSTTPELEVFPMCTGYVADRQVIAPGRSEIVYRAIPPVDIVLAGLSAMAGGVPVQVVLERLELDGRPEQLESFDGISKRISGWYARARYSAAELDDRDTARVAVTAAGPHKVILRIGAGKVRPQSVELDAVEVKFVAGAPAPRLAVAFDPQVVRPAIAAAAQSMVEQQQNGR